MSLFGSIWWRPSRRSFFQPMSVVTVQLNRRPVDRIIIDLSICYFIVNIFLILGGGCFMVLIDEMDYVTGMSSVIATLMNIGPGFGTIGPSENYAHISDLGKWFLSLEHAGGPLGDVFGPGRVLSLFLEKINTTEPFSKRFSSKSALTYSRLRKTKNLTTGIHLTISRIKF